MKLKVFRIRGGFSSYDHYFAARDSADLVAVFKQWWKLYAPSCQTTPTPQLIELVCELDNEYNGEEIGGGGIHEQ